MGYVKATQFFASYHGEAIEMVKAQMQEQGITITPDSLASWRIKNANYPQLIEVQIIDGQGEPHSFETIASSPIIYEPPPLEEKEERKS